MEKEILEEEEADKEGRSGCCVVDIARELCKEWVPVSFAGSEIQDTRY